MQIIVTPGPGVKIKSESAGVIIKEASAPVDKTTLLPLQVENVGKVLRASNVGEFAFNLVFGFVLYLVEQVRSLEKIVTIAASPPQVMVSKRRNEPVHCGAKGP